MKRLGAIVFVALGVLSCKRHKPPALDRVWLGETHGCALEKNAGLACWGANGSGQLGDNTKLDRRFATRTTVLQRPDALALSTRSTCGLWAGALRCFGTDPPKDVPAAGLSVIAAGHDSTCVASKDGGWCFGIGNLSFKPEGAWLKGARLLAGAYDAYCAAYDEPTRSVRCNGGKALLEGSSVVSLAVGGSHRCASVEQGLAMCWGDNSEGQLGDGTKVSKAEPVVLSGLPDVASIHAGSKHTCARMKNGTVYCWGKNDHSQLADGTKDNSLSPRAMYGLVGVRELAVAGDGACARLSDGSLRCWGANDSGQLGDGSTFENTVPMPIRWRATDGQ